MGLNTRAVIEVPTWAMVSTEYPCSVCGSNSECSILENDDLVHCMNIVCEWPVLAGGWIHRSGDLCQVAVAVD